MLKGAIITVILSNYNSFRNIITVINVLCNYYNTL